mgnify:CR=1 FL=1
MTIPLGIFNPAQAAFLLGIAAVLGACLGSFVNCLAWRLANGESVLAGRSHCTSCGHVLGRWISSPWHRGLRFAAAAATAGSG